MSRGPLLLLLTVTLGCATHRTSARSDGDSLPSLPASHAHLSRKLSDHARNQSARQPSVTHPPGSPAVELAPDQASRVFAEAQQALAGQPTPQAVLDAWTDVSGACQAHLLEACDFLRTAFRYGGLEGGLPPPAHRPLQAGDHSLITLRCTVSRDAALRDCRVVEGLAPDLDAAFLKTIEQATPRVSTFAGHPVDFPLEYTFELVVRGRGQRVTTEERLQELRWQARTSAKSSAAWQSLAQALADQPQETPELFTALERLRLLDPDNAWASSELALRELRAGRPAQALPLADEAWAHAPFHPYVLEVYAAAVAAAGRCDEAKAEQRRALELLPEGWPEPERERFRATLADYEAGCTAQPWSARPTPDTRMAAQHTR